MDNVAILVFACDRYELLFKGFDFFFKKNWDQIIPLIKYFSTEKKELELEGYINLKSGYGAWSDRLKLVLNQIDQEYIILIQEDMWFSKKMPENVLEPILNYVISNEIKLLKLHSAGIYKTEQLDVDFKGFRLSRVVKKESDFLMSHQISIWNKSFLYAQLKNNEHPWRNERRGTKRLKKVKDEIYHIDLLSENGVEPINENSPNIEAGEYLTISENACIRPNVKKIISELSQALPEYAKNITFHMNNNITHDGKKKPRKEDFFKKMKNNIRLLTINKHH